MMKCAKTFTDEFKEDTAKGSILFILLICVALFAALGYAVSQGFRLNLGTTDAAKTDQEKLNATSVIDYFQHVAEGVQEMKYANISPAAIDFTLPDDPSFDTPPLDKKIFHPQGGNVQYTAVWSQVQEKSNTPRTQWAFFQNSIEGVGGTASELIASLSYIDPPLCQELNRNILGSTTIPSFSGTLQDLFIDGTTPITSGNCAACVGKPMLCVSDGTDRVFYFVLDRG